MNMMSMQRSPNASPVRDPDLQRPLSKPDHSSLLYETGASATMPRNGRKSSTPLQVHGLTIRHGPTKSTDPAPRTVSATRTTQAAIKAARLSAGAHVTQDFKEPQIISPTPRITVKAAPYLAAAAKAWSNSSPKMKSEKTGEKIVPAKVETSTKVTAPVEAVTMRKSAESSRTSRSETRPSVSRERSKSRQSETARLLTPPPLLQPDFSGPMQAARISFEARKANEVMAPPSRPASARPSTYPFNANDKRFSQSNATLSSSPRQLSPPPVGKTSMDVTNRSALAAASVIWAHHDLEHPKSSTPVIEDYHYIVHKPHTTLRKTHKEAVGKFLKHGRVQPIPPSDRRRYEGLWAANKGILLDRTAQDEVCNIVVRDIWQRSRLQSELLAAVYDLVDRTHKGSLARDEFVVGTWLVDHLLRGRKLPLRADLPDEIFDRGPLARLGVSLPKKLKKDEKKLSKHEKPSKVKKGAKKWKNI